MRGTKQQRSRETEHEASFHRFLLSNFYFFTFLQAVGCIAWLGSSFFRQLGCPKHPGPKLPIAR
jgi:hypothetical protein